MDALQLLLNRRSVSYLTTPAPKEETLDNIIYAGMRAPDHGGLQPWRFIVIEGEGLKRLSLLFEEVAIKQGATEEEKDKLKEAPFRAPMIIIVIANYIESAKIPQWEQIVSAGCVIHAMQMAAVAQGYGGIWRTGKMTEAPLVRQVFNCEEMDKIVGFLYLGTPKTKAAPVKKTNYNNLLSYF